MTVPPTLYTYWRSGSSQRVRIALALKGIAYESLPVHLVRDGGEHNRPEYLAVNPQGRLPALRLPDGEVLIQSSAILECLEETVPQPSLLPSDPVARAKVRAVAAIIGCDIHPVNNAAVLNTLRRLGQDEATVSAWVAQWITAGFSAVEQMIDAQGWCFGSEPGMADIYLLPQIYSAQRFGVSLAGYPKICRVALLADRHPAFAIARPERQPDAA